MAARAGVKVQGAVPRKSGTNWFIPAFVKSRLGESGKRLEEATIEFTENAYSPSMVTVKAGSHVKLNLINNKGQGCIQAFRIPSLGVQKIVRVGTTESLEFDAPQEKGGITFMCSMGMYQGTINVI